jgi:hypothetical protein
MRLVTRNARRSTLPARGSKASLAGGKRPVGFVTAYSRSKHSSTESGLLKMVGLVGLRNIGGHREYYPALGM